MTWTCHACSPPSEFTSWTAAENHARNEHHGARISVDIRPRRAR